MTDNIACFHARMNEELLESCAGAPVSPRSLSRYL